MTSGPVVALASLQWAFCALEASGSVKCWGDNNNLFGDATTDGIFVTPQPVSGLSGVAAITAGNTFVCATLVDATVRCWGTNYLDELGVPGGGVMVGFQDPMPGTTVKQVVSGSYASCALLTGGAVWCWGDNQNGSLGRGMFGGSGAPGPSLATNMVALFGGAPFCGIHPDGTVDCWGSGAHTPTPIAGIADAVEGTRSVYENVFIRRASGSVMRTKPDGAGGFEVPSVVPGAAPAVRMSAAVDLCVLRPDASVACSPGTSGAFAPVAGLPAVVAVESGEAYAYDTAATCAILASGGVQCWGGNKLGELGNDKPDAVRSPTKVPGLSGVTMLALDFHATSAVAGGTLAAWGKHSAFGTLATASPSTLAPLGTDVVWARLGGQGGRAYVGHAGSTVLHVFGATPAGAGLLASPSQLSSAWSGKGWDAGFTPGGVVYVATWTAGGNDYGLFGDGTVGGTTPPEVKAVPGLTGVTALAVFANEEEAAARICSVAGTSTKCWGAPAVAIGDGSAGDAAIATPTLVQGSHDFAELCLGPRFSCGITTPGSGGELWCWGDDTAVMALGGSASPVKVTGVSGATSIGCGNKHVCVQTSGGLACWGNNDFGQLGDGTRTARTTPVPVVVSDVAVVRGGAEHTCVVHGSGEVSCWGNSNDGQVGTGKTGSYPTPQTVIGYP